MEVLLLGEKCAPYLSIFSENLDESWKISTWKPEEGSDTLIEKYKCHAIYFITTKHLMNPKDWLSFTKANVANNCSPSVNALNTATVLAISSFEFTLKFCM